MSSRSHALQSPHLYCSPTDPVHPSGSSPLPSPLPCQVLTHPPADVQPPERREALSPSGRQGSHDPGQVLQLQLGQRPQQAPGRRQGARERGIVRQVKVLRGTGMEKALRSVDVQEGRGLLRSRKDSYSVHEA